MEQDPVVTEASVMSAGRTGSEITMGAFPDGVQGDLLSSTTPALGALGSLKKEEGTQS